MTEKEQKLFERIMALLAKHTKRLDKLEEVANAQQGVLHGFRGALEAHHGSLAALAGLLEPSETGDTAPGDVN